MPVPDGAYLGDGERIWQNNEKNGLKRFRQRTIICMFGEQNTK